MGRKWSCFVFLKKYVSINIDIKQIINFTKSVYFRIREIKFNEPFPSDNEDLYPGEYLIDFANNIYSYRSKYPHLFIYPKKNFINNKKQLKMLRVYK